MKVRVPLRLGLVAVVLVDDIDRPQPPKPAEPNTHLEHDYRCLCAQCRAVTRTATV